MKISEIIKEDSCGGTSSGSIATVNTPLNGNLKDGQFFGGDQNSSIYGPIKKKRKKNANK